MGTRILRIAIVLLCAVALTACDRGCDIFVCNSSDEEAMLYREPIAIGQSVEPCSVQIVQITSCSFPVSVRVTDPSGADVYTATLEPKQTPRGMWQVDVHVPAKSPGTCPESLPDRHVVVVQNDTDEQVTPVVNKEELGTVEPRNTMTFGPFEGELRFIPPTRILDPEGQRVPWYAKVKYLLSDELAEYRIVVSRRPWAK